MSKSKKSPEWSLIRDVMTALDWPHWRVDDVAIHVHSVPLVVEDSRGRLRPATWRDGVVNFNQIEAEGGMGDSCPLLPTLTRNRGLAEARDLISYVESKPCEVKARRLAAAHKLVDNFELATKGGK